MLSANDVKEPKFKLDFTPESGKYYVAVTKEVLTDPQDNRNFTLVKVFEENTPVEEWEGCVIEQFKAFDNFGLLLIEPDGKINLFCPPVVKNNQLN